MDYSDVRFTPTNPPDFDAPRFCFNVTINNDDLVEGTEQFNVTGSILISELTLSFSPGVTTVQILDDDLAMTTPTPTDSVTVNPGTTTEGIQNLGQVKPLLNPASTIPMGVRVHTRPRQAM